MANSSLFGLDDSIIGQWGKPSSGDSVDRAVIESEDNDSCKTTGVTDTGIIKSSKWKTIIASSILVYNTINSLKMAKLQRDIGEKYLELAESHRNYYNTKYKPLEIDLTKEAAKLPKYVRDKEQLNVGQMLVTIRGRNAGRVDKAVTCTGRYCTGQRAAIITDQLLEQAAMESMASGMAKRYTDREEINRNNLRWEKREQVLKIGRDIPSDAVSYASLAAGTFGSLGKQAGKAAEGAAGFLGYGRADTNYPARRGPLTVSEYRYRPTPIEDFKPQKTIEIKLSG